MILPYTQSPLESSREFKSLKFVGLLLSHITVFTQGAHTLLYCTMMKSQTFVTTKCCPAGLRKAPVPLWVYGGDVNSRQGSPAHQKLLLSEFVSCTKRTGMFLLCSFKIFG